jgi:hypothetical protein
MFSNTSGDLSMLAWSGPHHMGRAAQVIWWDIPLTACFLNVEKRVINKSPAAGAISGSDIQCNRAKANALV